MARAGGDSSPGQNLVIISESSMSSTLATRERRRKHYARAKNAFGNSRTIRADVFWISTTPTATAELFQSRLYEYMWLKPRKIMRTANGQPIHSSRGSADTSTTGQRGTGGGKTFRARITASCAGATVSIAGSLAGTFHCAMTKEFVGWFGTATDINDRKERWSCVARKRREIAAPHRRRAGIRDVPDGFGQSRSSTGAKARRRCSAGLQRKRLGKPAI